MRVHIPRACVQDATHNAEVDWQAQQPGDRNALAHLRRAVSDEEYRQSRMGGLPGECKIKAASTGGTSALLVLIKYIQSLLASVLPRTFMYPPVF
jgi:hypothetical protein